MQLETLTKKETIQFLLSLISMLNCTLNIFFPPTHGKMKIVAQSFNAYVNIRIQVEMQLVAWMRVAKLSQ